MTTVCFFDYDDQGGKPFVAHATVALVYALGPDSPIKNPIIAGGAKSDVAISFSPAATIFARKGLP